MGQAAMKHGQLYVTASTSSLDKLGRWLIAAVLDLIACPHSLQSLAVVLFHAHAFQLHRDDFDGSRAEFLALALVDRRRR